MHLYSVKLSQHFREILSFNLEDVHQYGMLNNVQF